MKTSFIILATVASTQAINITKVYKTLRDLFRDDKSKCDIANMGTICRGVDNCPPCWIKNKRKYDCYAKVNGQCPWPGMVDRQKQDYPAAYCYRGNQETVLCDHREEKCPPCWKDEGSGHNSCFDYVQGKCPWSNMIEFKG